MSAPDSITSVDLDLLLTTQLIVAHAGESSPDDPRLGWWETDIMSRDGGLDVFRRLYPRSWRWAALRAVRAAARAFDQAARKRQAAEPDRITTLFHFGFALDEQLDDHLDQLAAEHPEDPTQALPALAPFIDFEGRRPFDREAFEAWLGTPTAPKTTAPKTTAPKTTAPKTTAIGRLLAASPDPTAQSLALRAALAPLSESYPLPYVQS